jgi:putative CocE/NonD family hydrolase
MRTRDGARLDADVYRPATEGNFPVLLMRQPYGRRIASTVCYAHPSWYAAFGYIVVIQDVRGRGTSEGTFRLFADDLADGYDTVQWAAALPGSTGAVGMYGFSYQGTNQLLAAAASPPALRAVAPAMLGWDLRTDWAYEGGAFCLQAGLGWAIQLAAESARLRGEADAYHELRRAAAALPLHGPLAARPELMERHRALSHFHDWIDTPDEDPYWRAISPAAHAAALRTPALCIGGWYDSHLPGTLAAFRALAGQVPARLVVGPWAHWPWGRRVGALDFGAAAISDVDALQVRWFDHWLKGEPDEFAPVRLFDMGARVWRDAPGFPSGGVTLSLHGAGRAGLDEDEGALRPMPPEAIGNETGGGEEMGGEETGGKETLVHDPWRPVPTVPAGQDRAPVDARPDVLTFTTARAPQAGTQREAMVLAGMVRADLHVTADAPDFDLSVTLSRVLPDGRVFALAEGFRRVTRAGDVAIPMRATCFTVPPGEALRLSVAAASFPAFPVNPGTGADPTRAAMIDARVITLRLRHGGRLVVGG